MPAKIPKILMELTLNIARDTASFIPEAWTAHAVLSAQLGVSARSLPYYFHVIYIGLVLALLNYISWGSSQTIHFPQ
jgi:hypothetical protein